MSAHTSAKPTVFISYSHKDEEWKDRFMPQLRALEQAERIVVWDDRKIDGGDKWYPEIIEAMKAASVAVCLISPDYLASGFCVKEEVPFLLKRCESDGMIFIPLLLRPCAWKAFDWLKEIQMLPRDGKNVVVDFKGVEDAVFAEVANLILKIVDDPAEYELPALAPPIWAPPEKIDIERLPETGSELFGRQSEMELLDNAWKSANTNVVSLVAWGGVGKSTLVNKWIERMQEDNYRGARRVYAWSFYSQGTGERVTSADQFIDHALTWFGDPDPTSGSPWDKGERLAKLIKSERTLLILDGLEPLQSGQTFERGRIKEPALLTLLTDLARQNSGLCLISTREKVTDLEEFSDQVIQKDLEQISDDAGRALLRVSDVRGTDAELEQATRDFGNHALAINLLAVYLHEKPGHHVSHASEIEDLEIADEEGKHPRRVMAALAELLGESAEVELLRMLGLFDRPADRASLRALRKAPAIPDLSYHIRRLSDAGWLRTVEKLRRYRLVSRQSKHRSDDLDAHPLVRQHFGVQLKEQNKNAWQAGNYRIFKHLKRTAKFHPSTLGEMAPLYAAVSHGCKAAKYEEALELFAQRILRGDDNFSTNKLGAFGADLSALASFFEEPWEKLFAGVTEKIRGVLFSRVGYSMMAQGCFADAIKPIKTALRINVGNRKWTRAAADAGNLSQNHLYTGNLNSALEEGQHSVRLAELSGDIRVKADSRSVVAESLLTAGRFNEAEPVFREVETLQKQVQPEMPFLYSVRGFYYCDLLLCQGKVQEAKTRALRTIEWVKPDNLLLSIALDQLTLGKVCLLEAEKGNLAVLAQAEVHLIEALDGLRQSGYQEFLCQGLLVRAQLYRVTRRFGQAAADLNRVRSIAQRGSMALRQVDYYLDSSRLFFDQDKKDESRENLETAKEMIERMGYHRRDKDVKEIEEQLGSEV